MPGQGSVGPSAGPLSDWRPHGGGAAERLKWTRIAPGGSGECQRYVRNRREEVTTYYSTEYIGGSISISTAARQKAMRDPQYSIPLTHIEYPVSRSLHPKRRSIQSVADQAIGMKWETFDILGGRPWVQATR